MKKIVCLIALGVSMNTLQCKAQKADSALEKGKDTVNPNFLLLKSKKQKTIAWILLGTGVATAIAGYVTMHKEADKDPLGTILGENTTGVGIFLAGDAIALGSIPFFISSAKNKRKASLVIKDESIYFNPRLNLKEHFAAVGIKIHL